MNCLTNFIPYSLLILCHRIRSDVDSLEELLCVCCALRLGNTLEVVVVISHKVDTKFDKFSAQVSDPIFALRGCQVCWVAYATEMPVSTFEQRALAANELAKHKNRDLEQEVYDLEKATHDKD